MSGGEDVKKLIFCMLLIIAGCVSLMCAADEISGKVDKVEPSLKIITVSGIKIMCENAMVENKMNMGADLFAVEPGAHLRIMGSFTGPAQMAASDIKITAAGGGVIKGVAGKVDPALRQISISGISVNVASSARIKGYEGASSTLDEISFGTYVECEGRWTGDRTFNAHSIALD